MKEVKKFIICSVVIGVLCGCATAGSNISKSDTKRGITVTSIPPECGVILCQGDSKIFLGTTPVTFNPTIFLKPDQLGWIVVSHRGYKSASVPIGQEKKPIEITLNRLEDTFGEESIPLKQISIYLLQIKGFRGSNMLDCNDTDIEICKQSLLTYLQQKTPIQNYELKTLQKLDIPVEKVDLLVSQIDNRLKGLLPEAMPYYSRFPTISDEEILTILNEMVKEQGGDGILCIYGAACFKPTEQKFGEALMWGTMIAASAIAAGQGYVVTPQPGTRYFWEGSTDKAIPKDRDGIALTGVIIKPKNGEILAFGKVYQPGKCTDKNIIQKVTEDVLLSITKSLSK